jgi:toxin CcdB
MEQFDVFANSSGKPAFPFVMVVQHQILSSLPVRLVAPMAPLKSVGGRPIARLNPVFKVGGVEMALLTQLLGAVATKSLRHKVENFAARRADIIAALDVLFSGV